MKPENNIDKPRTPTPEWECIKDLSLINIEGEHIDFLKGYFYSDGWQEKTNTRFEIFPAHLRKVDAKLDRVKELTQDSEPEENISYNLEYLVKDMEEIYNKTPSISTINLRAWDILSYLKQQQKAAQTETKEPAQDSEPERYTTMSKKEFLQAKFKEIEP